MLMSVYTFNAHCLFYPYVKCPLSYDSLKCVILMLYVGQVCSNTGKLIALLYLNINLDCPDLEIK